MITSHNLDEAAAAPVEATATYLVNHTRELHYDRALADGLPIATGVIEGPVAIWSRIAWAAPEPAGPWKAPKAVLRLPALRASGDFDDYWQFHVAKEYERNHKSRYADGEVPNRCQRREAGRASSSCKRSKLLPTTTDIKEPHPTATRLARMPLRRFLG